MAKLAELRKQAKTLGIGPSTIRLCNTAEELQEVIDEFQGESNGDAPVKASKKHAVKKSAVKKAVAKKKGNSKSASSKSVPAAKSAKSGKAKRPTAAKSSKGTDGPSGRHMLDGVDYSADEGWNARDGSAPDLIVRALKRFKGNRSKVFDHLVGDVWDFVGKKKRDGSKRTKADAEAMLRYRIARTAWDFAVQTGQHEKSENRAEYGTAGTGAGVWKPAKKGNSKPKAASTKKKGNSKKPASESKSSTKASTRKSASKRKGGKKRASKK